MTRAHCRGGPRWVGTPYHHQASVKGAGCDCLGLIRGVWRELLGAEPEAMPAYTRDWGDVTGAEPLLAAARRNLIAIDAASALAGDVLVFRMRAGVAKHAGILWRYRHERSTSAERSLERRGTADHPRRRSGRGVAEIGLTRWWRRRLAAAFAFPGVN